jgi:polar amino acid transport system substrate-binding protein
MSKPVRALPILLAGVLVIGLAGCSSASDSGSTSHPKGDPAVVAKVPSDLKSGGTLQVMTDPTYPPLETVDSSGNIVGSDFDLMNAIASKMGLNVKWTKGSFDGIIPGLVANRYDASIAGMYISNDKYSSVRMIQYGVAFNQVLVQPSYKGPQIESDTDMCGLTIAIQTGSTGIDEIKAASKTCGSKGKSPINLLEFQSANDALLAVTSARATGDIVGNVSSNYQIDQIHADLRVGGTLPTKYYEGIAVAKDSTQLAQAISLALQKLQASGEYQKILTKWKVQDTAVSQFPVNPKV